MIKILLVITGFAILHALFEIQIEGATGGWAKNLPCWRWRGIFEKIFKKPLTGFHFFLFAIVVGLFHTPYLFMKYEHGMESYIWMYLLIYFPTEDLCWFIFNPAYGIKKFLKKEVPWHKVWFLGLPKAYWICFGIATILYFLPKVF